MDRNISKTITVTSGGTAQNVELGFVPDVVRIKTMTRWDTQAAVVAWDWYKDMGDGYCTMLTNENANPPTKQAPTIETTNGITAIDTNSFTNSKLTIDTGATKITQAVHAVVETAAAHGLSTGAKVTFHAITSGMTEIEGMRSTITVLTATTFSCDDIDSTGFTAWDATLATGQVVVTSTLQNDAGYKGITLGSAVATTTGDVLLIEAYTSEYYDA